MDDVFSLPKPPPAPPPLLASQLDTMTAEQLADYELQVELARLTPKQLAERNQDAARAKLEGAPTPDEISRRRVLLRMGALSMPGAKIKYPAWTEVQYRRAQGLLRRPDPVHPKPIKQFRNGGGHSDDE